MIPPSDPEGRDPCVAGHFNVIAGVTDQNRFPRVASDLCQRPPYHAWMRLARGVVRCLQGDEALLQPVAFQGGTEAAQVLASGDAQAHFRAVESLQCLQGAWKQLLVIVMPLPEGKEGLAVMSCQRFYVVQLFLHKKACDRQLQRQAHDPPNFGQRGRGQSLRLEGFSHAAMDIGLAVYEGAVEIKKYQLERMASHRVLRMNQFRKSAYYPVANGRFLCPKLLKGRKVLGSAGVAQRGCRVKGRFSRSLCLKLASKECLPKAPSAGLKERKRN